MSAADFGPRIVGNAGEALELIGNVLAMANEHSIVAQEPDGTFLLLSNDVTYAPKQQLGWPLEFLVQARFSNTHSEHRDGRFTESRERPIRACFTTSAACARMAASCRRSASASRN